jgi:hypothetical protein
MERHNLKVVIRMSIQVHWPLPTLKISILALVMGNLAQDTSTKPEE